MTLLYILLSLILVALVFIGRQLYPLAKTAQRAIARWKHREGVIGFGPTIIPARKQIRFRAEPSANFEGSRFIVPSMLANNFTIEDILVGDDSQAVSRNAIPAAAFSELAVGVALGMDPANKERPLEIIVNNITDQQQTFCAAMIGWVPKDFVRSPNDTSMCAIVVPPDAPSSTPAVAN